MSIIGSLSSLCVHNCSTPEAVTLTRGQTISIGPKLCGVRSSENRGKPKFARVADRPGQSVEISRVVATLRAATT
jgi:hypothetical protein